MAKKLYIPGPTQVSPDMLAAMAQPMIGHRTKEYAALHKDVVEHLRWLLNTRERVFLSTSSSFGIMEGAVRNLVGKRCVNFANGAFSKKWHDVTLRCGKEADMVEVEWGKPITPELVDKALATGKYDAMTMIHNETSTGVMSPVEEIADVMQRYPEVSFILDTVSSMSAVPLDLDALKTDVCIAGVQKAFALPAGLAICAVSERALEKAKTIPGRGYYFDFVEFAASDEKNNTPSTPCISQIFALQQQLLKMASEGLEKRYQRHREMAEATRSWALSRGFTLFPEPGSYSMTLTCIRNDDRTDLEALKKLAGERGYAIDNGYGKIKNKTFRIAHMGDYTLKDMQELFDLLDELLPAVRT